MRNRGQRAHRSRACRRRRRRIRLDGEPNRCEGVVQGRDRREHQGRDDEEQALSLASQPSPGRLEEGRRRRRFGRERFIALAPSSIRTAVKHEIAWFRRIKANPHYSNQTPLGSFSLSDNKKIANFEKTQCGITFST